MFAGEEVCSFLENKGYVHLYHANAASTALSFLENRRILTRDYVNKNRDHCWQTKQKSDDTDVALGIFDDIFFDVENLWERGNYVNLYGPAVFKFSTRVLNGSNVEITRYNPIRGRGDLYFSSLEAAGNSCIAYNSWQFCNHIVIKRAGNSIRLNCLEEIKFYVPNSSLSKDSRNDPYKACSIIQQKCMASNIAFDSCVVDHERIPLYKYPVFYGFMGNVPRLQGQL